MSASAEALAMFGLVPAPKHWMPLPEAIWM